MDEFTYLIAQETLDIGLSALMNGIEVIPSFKYLANQIPGMNYIANTEMLKVIAPYQHYIYTGLHAIGNTIYTYYNALDPVPAIASTITYSLKPQAYIFRDNLLQYLDQNNDGWVKYVTHVATDSALSAVIALPIAISNPTAFSYFIAQGAITGSINYYNSQIREDNIIGQGLAAATTIAGLYPCYLMVNQQPDLLTKIIAIEGCIPALAAIHLNTKFVGDAAYDVGNNVYSYLAGNSTNLEI